MYEGWFAFGGTEVINGPRCRSYIENTMPHLQIKHGCNNGCGCDHLAAFMQEGEYATPLQDDAPWVDPDRPESFSFLGVYPLGVTGVNDDTATATIVEGIGDGGWVTGQRRAPKQMRFTAALFSETESAANYGLQWLKSTLEGACADGCYASDQLCYLTECVDPETFQGVVRSAEHGLSEWALHKAGWQGQKLILREGDSTAKVSVAGGCGEVEWLLKIRGEEGNLIAVLLEDRVDLIPMTGEVQTLTFTGDSQWIGLGVPPLDGLATWTTVEGVDTVGEGARWSDLSGSGFTPENAATWSRVATLPTRIDVISLTSKARYELSHDECAAEFYRFIRRVVRVEGPRVMRTDYPAQGGVITTVEWLLVSEQPYIYGSPVRAVTGSSEKVSASAQPYRVVRLSRTIEQCIEETVTAVVDPAARITPPPPRVLLPPDPIREEYPPGRNVKPYALIIPAETIPQWLSAVPVVHLSAGGKDVRFVTVRFFPMPFDTLTPGDIDPCSSCGSFEVSYIPKGRTFVIDAADRRAYVDEVARQRPADHLVTQPGGRGGMQWPVLSCGVSYLVIVDAGTQDLNRITIDMMVRE